MPFPAKYDNVCAVVGAALIYPTVPAALEVAPLNAIQVSFVLYKVVAVLLIVIVPICVPVVKLLEKETSVAPV